MALILLADDDARSRELLVAQLARAGHQIIVAQGQQLVASAEAHRPDLVILDAFLAGTDGFELTRDLKRRTGAGFLPVVLLLPGDDPEARVSGVMAGADEFLVRPLARSEVLLRIGSLLALREARREVEESRGHLAQLKRFNDSINEVLIHDLKNPLAILAANIEYSRQEIRLEGRHDLSEALEDSLAACSKLQRMVGNLLDVNRLEEGKRELACTRVAFGPMLAELSRLHRRAAQDRAVVVELHLDEPGVEADADPEVLGRALDALMDTALRITPRRGQVGLSTRRAAGSVQVRVASSAGPVPTELRSRLFEKYTSLERDEHHLRLGTGFGLYFCRLALEAHGGRVFLEDGEGPTAFIAELPAGAAR